MFIPSDSVLYLQSLRVAQVYFRDFVRRCRDYQITEVHLPVEEEEEEENDDKEEEERKGDRRKAKPSPVKKGMPTPEVGYGSDWRLMIEFCVSHP